MLDDKHLQERAESGKGDESVDSLAYQKVFEALKKDSSSGLRTGFADRVLQLVEKRETKWFSGFEWVLAIGAGLFSIAAFATAVVLTEFKPDFGFLNDVSRYHGLFIFGAAFVMLIHFVDRKIARKRLSA